MSSKRSIRQRIANVSSVEQIIKAMDMVASTKLIKARAQLEGVRPIYNDLKRIVEETGAEEEALSHMFYERRRTGKALYIILTGNRGLAGGYNSNICKKALEHMGRDGNEQLVVTGSRGHDFFRNQQRNIVHSIIDVSDANVYYASENLANKATELFSAGEVDEVFVAYTRFDNVLTHVPVVEMALPVIPGEKKNDIDHEPDLNTFIDNLIPLYMHMYLFRALSEAHTSEQAARMINMDAAGKNASEIIENLNRIYNRKRQAAITQEISEIVGSAGVLNKGEADDR